MHARSRNRRHDVPLLFKYASAPTAMTILRSGSLRWSSPLRFNDPFDTRRNFELPFTNAKFCEAVVARFESYLAGEGTPRTPQSKLLLEALRLAEKTTPVPKLLNVLRNTLSMTSLPLETARHQFREVWSERIPGMRILCFSSDPESPTMWAHYAGGFTGAVLGFESSDDRDSPWLLARPVVYRNEPPSLPPVETWVKTFLGEAEIDSEVYLSEYYYVKSPDWSYEKEYRVPSDCRTGEQGPFSDYQFFPEDLREVILGPSFLESDATEVKAIVSANYPAAQVRRAHLDHINRRVTVS